MKKPAEAKKPAEEKIDPETAKKIEELIKEMKDKDEFLRSYAANALVKIGKSAVQPLIKALKDEDENVHSLATFALGGIGDKRAVQPLIEALKNEDVRMRCDTALALGEIKDTRAVKPLVEALKDKSSYIDRRFAKSGRHFIWSVSECAAQALGKIGDKSAVKPLINALYQAMTDENMIVSTDVEVALRDITGKDFGEDYKKWLEWWEENKEKWK